MAELMVTERQSLSLPATNETSDALSVRGEASCRIKRLAREVGFDLVGITSALPFDREKQAIDERVDQGMFSGLPWFTKERAAVSYDPRSLQPAARSIIALGICYDTSEGPAGVVARYAWGEDYHQVLARRLDALRSALEAEFGDFESRTFVDTGRMIDRAAAVRAGFGWYGKNTNVLNSRFGSWLFLAEIVTTLDLECDQPTRQHCGQCSACLEICPTRAIVAPYVVDNNRCISFLTIELRGAIPRELRPLMGRYIFGCDLCQDVCPVNAQARPVHHPEFAFRGRLGTVSELAALLQLDDERFRQRFQRSPIKRAKRRGLLRNVAVALGNCGDRAAVPPLVEALRDPEPLVRGHAAWALGRLGGDQAQAALQDALGSESDAYVLEEIGFALAAR